MRLRKVFLQVCVSVCAWTLTRPKQQQQQHLKCTVTEASRWTKKKNRIRLLQMFWQLFIQQFFISYIRTSKLNIINPTDNGRETPPLRCDVSNQALSAQLDMKPPYFTKVHEKPY